MEKLIKLYMKTKKLLLVRKNHKIEPNGSLYDEDQQLWENTLRDGLQEFEVFETIQKIRNYYNGHHNIDGRPPSRKDFNDYLDSLEK